MSMPPGREERATLLIYFRDILVSRWPERVSMETILADAGLAAEKYIVDTPRPEDRWHQALKRIDQDNKLMRLIDEVRRRFDEPDEAIEQLAAAEYARNGPAAARSSSAGRIFICYRRQDTRYPAGSLFRELAGRFGQTRVFKDIESILPGRDFVEEIRDAVGSCAVLLALIGDQWLTLADESGRRRLDDPEDFVRMEIEAALERCVPVIPVLVGEARMPRAAELPSSLARLANRQALELSDTRFEYDMNRLVKALDQILGGRESRYR